MRCSIEYFHKYKMSIGLCRPNEKKTRSSALRLSCPTYGRRGIRAQNNSDS